MNYKQLMAKAAEIAGTIKTLLAGESPDMNQIAQLQKEAEGLVARAEAIKSADGILSAVGEPNRPELPTGADAEPEVDTKTEKEGAVKALYTLQFGEPDAAVKSILTDLHGKDYTQKRYEQRVGFIAYLRTGQNPTREFLWTPDTVKTALNDGQDVRAMKAVMVEAQDTLGGALVPEDWRADIVSRMTAIAIVRPLARVVQTSRDVLVLPKRTGGGSQLRGNVSVTWVDETPTAGAAATNETWGSEKVPVHTVMAEIFLSRSLVEDAAYNIASDLAQSFAEAQAVDEDNQFLVGDGNGKPEGILKGSGNAILGAAQTVNSGNASAMTADGVIDLTYGIDAVYRQNAVFVAEKATYKAIRKLKTGDGEYIWERNYQVGQPAQLQGYRVYEQEGMPSIASNAYPLLFGDFYGYVIADRVGMSVERYLDSATARIDQICFIARRRLGGGCTDPWRFAVQKVSA